MSRAFAVLVLLGSMTGPSAADVTLRLSNPSTGKVFESVRLRHGVASVDENGVTRVVLFAHEVRCDTPDTDAKGWVLALETGGDASLQNGPYGDALRVPAGRVKLSLKRGRRATGKVTIDHTDPRRDTDQRVRATGSFDVPICTT